MRSLSLVSWKLLVVSLGCVITLGQLMFVTSQDDKTLNPITALDRIFPANMAWLVDSKVLIFRNAISETKADDWYTYDVETKLFELSDKRSLPNMTEEVQQVLEGVNLSTNEEIILISQSPDDRYVIYGLLNGEEIVTNYGSFPSVQPGIADLEQDQVFTISDVRLPGIGNILWSDDSSSVMFVNTISPFTWVEVRYLNTHVSNLSQSIIQDFGIVSIEDNEYAVNGAYDLSEDGSQLLLRISFPGSYTYDLAIYNARFPTRTYLVEGVDATQVVAASFAPSDENKIWLLNEMGIVQYDLLTNETVILNDSVNSVSALAVTLHDPAIFSPDGRYLAVLQASGLYVIDLSDESDQITSDAIEVSATP